jgi:hypothetical protein
MKEVTLSSSLPTPPPPPPPPTTTTNGYCSDSTTTMPVTLTNGDATKTSASSKKSYIHGASSIPLLDHTIGERLRIAVDKVPDREVFIFKRDGIRKTYRNLMHDVGV